MAKRYTPDTNSSAAAKLFESDGRVGDVFRTDSTGDCNPDLMLKASSFDPYAGCLFCTKTPCACPPVQFGAWGVLVSFPDDGMKGWIMNPDTVAMTINERASREAYQWTSATAPESYVAFLRHKFKRENCIIKIKPLY